MNWDIFIVILLGLCVVTALFLLYRLLTKGADLYNLPPKAEELIKENAYLRLKIAHLRKEKEMLEDINRALTNLAPVFSWDQLKLNLKKANLPSLGITKSALYTRTSDILEIVYEENLDAEALDSLKTGIDLTAKVMEVNPKRPIVDSNTLFLKDPQLTSRIKNTLSATFFCFYYIYHEEIPSAVLVCATDQACDPGRFTALVQFIGQHLVHITNIINIYQDLIKKQQDLEMTIKNRTQELQEAIDKISQINRSKSEFVSTVAHELRTSLTAILGFATLIYDGKLGEIPPNVKDRINRIRNQVKRLVEMVNTLLDINRIESGKVEMHPEPLDAKTLLTTTADVFAQQLNEKGIELGIECPEGIVIEADRIYMERVIHNLVSNAIKFTPSGGRIELICKELGDDRIELIVKDTGVGISERDLPNIFKEFYSVDRPDVTKIRGIGLGLSLVKRVIDAHDGEIYVKSKLNEGTTFIIHLKGKKQEARDV